MRSCVRRLLLRFISPLPIVQRRHFSERVRRRFVYVTTERGSFLMARAFFATRRRAAAILHTPEILDAAIFLPRYAARRDMRKAR